MYNGYGNSVKVLEMLMKKMSAQFLLTCDVVIGPLSFIENGDEFLKIKSHSIRSFFHSENIPTH